MDELVIIGGGISSLIPAIELSSKYHITIFDKKRKNDILARRILVAGNGRCNFFNEKLLNSDNYDVFYLHKLKDFFFNREDFPNAFFHYLTVKLSFSYYKEGDLYYPFFNRSESIYNFLISKIDSHVSVKFNDVIKIDRIKKEVTYITNGKESVKPYDKIIFAPGGFSYDREVDYLLLDSLRISYRPFSPSLVPIKVREKTLSLKNQRLRGNCSLLVKGKIIYSEEGEVLFKEDGLSGIVIMNLSLYINELLKDGYNKEEISIQIDFSRYQGFKLISDLSAYPKFLIEYLNKNKIKDSKLLFHFQDFYPFKDSQVSYGGINIELLNHNFSLKEDKDLYAIGEVLDVNLPCGGYNIGSTLIESYIVMRDLWKK